MRAACFFGVLVVAKVLVLAGTQPAFGAWAPVAYFWQDALVALAAAALDVVLRRPRIGWVVYGLLVFYIAWSVPVAIVLGTPMTWTPNTRSVWASAKILTCPSTSPSARARPLPR